MNDKDIWKEMEHDYNLWTSMKGCSLTNQWIYEAFLDLNKRLKDLESKVMVKGK